VSDEVWCEIERLRMAEELAEPRDAPQVPLRRERRRRRRAELIPERVAGQKPYKLPDGRVCIDCPVCGQAARVICTGHTVWVECWARCPEEELAEALAERRTPPRPPRGRLAPAHPEWGFNLRPTELARIRGER
jgi:hypothetical protein